MSKTMISGITEDVFCQRTRSALDTLNGNPVKKRQFDAFVTEQLGLKNRHLLSTCFASAQSAPLNTSPQDPASRCDREDAILLMDAIASDTMEYDAEVAMLRELLATAVTYLSPDDFETIVKQSVDPSLEENAEILEGGKATGRFIAAHFEKKDAGEGWCKRGCAPLSGGFCQDETCPYSDYMQSVEEGSYYEGKVPDAQRRHEILLEVVTDDGQVEADADVALYFYKALQDGTLPATLSKLEGEGLSGEAGVDNVFEWMTGEDASLDNLLNYCLAAREAGIEQSGYQATLDAETLKDWLNAHVPGWQGDYPQLIG